MDDYYTYVQSQISPSHEEDTVFDTHAEERLLVENLLKEVELLNRDIREEDNRNAKRIKAVQDDISAFRIAITEKEARIK